MKVRIGVGMLGWPFPKRDPAYLWEFIALAEDLGVDSVWVSDRVPALGLVKASFPSGTLDLVRSGAAGVKDLLRS